MRPTPVLSILALTLALSGCQNTVREVATPTSAVIAPNGEQLITFPTTDQGRGYEAIIDDIAHAKTSVTMEMYSLHDDLIEQALVAAKQRGVKITVMLNSEFGGSAANCAKTKRTCHGFNQSTYDFLTTNGVKTLWSPSGYIFHIKTYVIDHTHAHVMSANLNDKNYKNSVDASYITRDPSIVKAIESTFEADFSLKGKPRDHTVTNPSLVWSPNAADQMIDFISTTKKTLDVSTEVISDKSMIAALDDAAKRGVAVRLLMTEDDTNAPAVTTLRRAGVKVSLLKESKNTPYIHEKQMIADSSRVLFGSTNMSYASTHRNRELSVIITNPTIVKTFVSTYQSYFIYPSS